MKIRKIVSLWLAVLMIASVMLPLCTNASGYKNEEDSLAQPSPPNPTYTIHSPTRIDSNADFSTYADSGSGTSGDPWVFDNWEIDGTGVGYCLYIGNTTDHFIVNNSYFHDASGNLGGTYWKNTGLFLYNVENGTSNNNTASYCERGICINQNSKNNTVSNNTTPSNNFIGIAILFSDDINIFGNTASSNNYGIYLGGNSENNVIANNNASSNTDYGIFNHNSDNNIIINNIASSNVGGSSPDGIRVSDDSENNNVTNNEVQLNGNHGIEIGSKYNNITDNRASLNDNAGIRISNDNNVVTNNTASSNIWNGIQVQGDNNVIINNTVSSNGDSGIYLVVSSGNVLYHNNIINNNNQSYDDTGNNYWNGTYPTGGNYWDDYSGIDDYQGSNQNIAGSDGIGDTNYTSFIGGGGAVDEYPLMEATDTIDGYTPRKPIRIDNNAEINASHGVSGGSGTQGDPYIIENKSIDGSGYGYCIYVGNTTKYFEIRNCSLYNASGNLGNYWKNTGIYFYNVENGTADNNNVSSNIGHGIFLGLSDNSTIANNTALNNNYGIVSFASNNNKLVNNTALSNSWHGIWFDSSNNSVLSDNIASSNNEDGIALSSSNDSILTNNTVSNNNHGIVFASSNGNKLTNNTITSNDNHSISFASSNNNNIYHNNFIDNTNHTYDSSANTWDNGYPSGGNYYDNYTGVDLYSGKNQDQSGSDGIGDTNYTIVGDSNADEYPLMKSYASPPQIIETEPALNSTVEESYIWLNVTFNTTMDTSITPSVNVTQGNDSKGWSFQGWSTKYQGDDTAKWTHNKWKISETKVISITNYSSSYDRYGRLYNLTFNITDTTPPSIIKTNPQDMTGGVPEDEIVTILFDDNMNTSVTPTLTQTNGTDLAGWSFLGWNTIYFTNDTASWSHNSWTSADNITLKVSNYNDTSNNVGSDYQWWFTIREYESPEITDNTPSTVTTGELFTFNTTITDNVKVESTYIEWQLGSSPYYNTSLINAHGDFYTKSIVVPHTVGNLFYNISAVDPSGNWNTARTWATVSDNDYPTISDNSLPSGTAGSTYTFNATITENVQFKSANPRVIYWTDATSLTNTTLSHTTQDFYERQISLPLSTSTLYYYINATDTSNLKTTTGKTTVNNITDNTAPSITDNTAGVPETDHFFEVNATITDANINQVRVYYYFDSTSYNKINTTMTNTYANYYNKSIYVPTNASMFYYDIMASDMDGRWDSLGLTGVAVSDVSNPTVLSTSPTGAQVQENADVIVVFDDTMDTSTIPTLTQTVGDTVSYTFMGWSEVGEGDIGQNMATWSHTDWSSEDSISLKVSLYDDNDGNTGADYSWSFTIRDHKNPTISLTSPSAGTTGVLLDADITIQFSETMNTSITPTLSQSTGTIVSYTFQGWTSPTVAKWNHSSKWDWGDTITLNVSGAYDDSNSQNIQVSYDWSFTVKQDAFKPHVNNTIPTVGASNVDADGDIYIFFNETMDSTHTPNLIINQGTDPGGWSITYMSNATYGNNITYGTIKYSHNTLSFSTTYQLTMSNYKDEAGNVGNDYTWGFTTESEDIPPQITSTVPTDGATDIVNNTDIVLNFNEPMDTGVGNMPSVTFNAGTQPAGWSGTWTSNSQLTYTVTGVWSVYEYINITVSDFKDVAGNSNSYTWDFRIADYIKPTVLSVTPPDDNPNTVMNTPIEIIFSESMDTSTTPTLSQRSGTYIPYAFQGWTSTNVADDTATWTHGDWQNDENIKMRVSGFYDSHGTMGNYYPTNEDNWNFTTEADTYPPQVISTSPSGGQENASLTSDIIIKFNDEMNGSYIPTLKDGNNTNYSFIEWRSTTYGNDTAVFSHPEYNGSQNYTLTIDHFQDTSENIGNPYSWTFTTEMTAEQRMVYRIKLTTTIMIAMFGAIVAIAVVVMITRVMKDTMDDVE
ncbi:hypothetical protein AKJ51_01575 [candidate division MSBL1 archaeon SCGC-AAA382A20]|uniref:Uncharacterized protein n=1 Tax=candidate division MSBL1 archaeon SCGC-AAA382A20 TaxID=1698280 RepID=A0A133VLQ1_9EURY|nr:hypothetical protein AKJ51_01575 [candidate division MSBL1 archaeon SCGC-AAA382A20]